MKDDGDEVVRAQYERWVYPRPIADLADPSVASQRFAGDPVLYAPLFWPDRKSRGHVEMLVAGCGANLAAKMAFDHPQINVLGIDISEASLDHARHLKAKHRLDNLALLNCRIEEVAALGRTFDLVDASGVLHHLEDPAAGLRALATTLRPDGVVHAMVYGRHGRAGIYLVQDLLRRLRLGQTKGDVAFAKQVVAALPAGHPVRHSVHLDASYDAGFVDLFLHKRDRAYSVAECLQLVEESGLAFQDWTDRYLYYPEAHLPLAHPLSAKLASLPEAEVWEAMELFHGNMERHDFVACRRDRDPSTFRVNFQDSGFMDMIPVPRQGLSIVRKGSDALELELKRWYSIKATVKGLLASAVLQVDGARSVRECFKSAAGRDVAVELCRETVRYLWRSGFVELLNARVNPGRPV